MRDVPGRAPLVILVAALAVACGSSSVHSPTTSPSPDSSASASATPSPAPTSTPSPSPALDVTPLIPVLAGDGTLNLLHEDGSTAGSFPPSTTLQLFSPLGDAFLGGSQSNGETSALVSIQAGGSLDTLQPIGNPSTFAGAVGALDGHAWAWLEGPLYSSQCNQGLSSGALEVGGPGVPARAITELPNGGATAGWSLGGWVGDDIWLVRASGCPYTAGSSTAAYIAHEDEGALTPVQSALGPGCSLDGVALDGSMLCATQPATAAATTWRFVGADGTVRNFSVSSFPGLCAGHGTLHDFEGIALSLDGGYISVDAGCFGTARFDQLFLINTATGAVTLVSTPTYLAANSWLPDGTLLCTDLSNAMSPQSYLVTTAGTVTRFAPGDAVWSTTEVSW